MSDSSPDLSSELAPLSQSILSEGSSYGAHWCSQLVLLSISQRLARTRAQVRHLVHSIYLQLGPGRLEEGEMQLESACEVSSRGG